MKLNREKIDRREVIKNILEPDKLVFVGVSESKNPKHKPIYISSEDDFMINGRIISVIKRYLFPLISNIV